MRLLLLFFLTLPAMMCGQGTLALPDIINYSKQNYKAGLQNWDITQSKTGLIYVANNEGVLCYDGVNWSLNSLPNKTNVRSIGLGPDSRLYVGGQDEIGYLMRGGNGKLEYVSLVKLIPEKHRSFGDIWDIAILGQDVFFRSASLIFRYNNQSVSVFNASLEWSYMGLCNGKLFAHDFRNGIYQFENDQWKPLFAANPIIQFDPVTGILPFRGDTCLVTTLKSGLFKLTSDKLIPFNTPELKKIAGYRIYHSARLGENSLALATNQNGLFIVNLNGELMQSYSRLEGLQNNNILCVFPDREGNIWLGLDNGIDMVSYSNPVKRVAPYGQDGAGYAALIFDKKLYIGTSGGLFSTPLVPEPDLSFSKCYFSEVTNTTGQTWGLAEVNGHLLLGHHEGPFEIRNNTAIPLLPMQGFWNFIPLSAVSPSPMMVSGHYKGLQFFEYKNGNFSPVRGLAGFTESSRFITLDNDDNIWVSHPYHGIYKIDPGDNQYRVELYKEDKGLPSSLNNHVYRIRNQVVIATEKGVYEYDPRSNRFHPSQYYRKYLGDQSIRYLKEDKEGNIWFIHEKSLGVLNLGPGDTSILIIPELNNKLNSGFEFIYPVDSQNIFVGAEKGFFHINYKKYRQNKLPFGVRFSEVQIFGKRDSILFGGYFNDVNQTQEQGESLVPDIPSKWHNIRFAFASALFSQQSNIEYSFILNGFDNEWSPWSTRTEKEYTRLPPGKYRFEVKARNKPGNESATLSYRFHILPPWYRTNVAFAVYLLLLGFSIIAFYRHQQRKFERQQLIHEQEQQKLLYLHQLEIDKAEAELVALRNEKLQAEIEFKNSELANSTMHLLQKGEMLGKLRSELAKVMKNVNNEKVSEELKKLIRTLSVNDKMEEEWENFTKHFDNVQRDFVSNLKQKYPSITPNELKLCAYLRMNLSTKEIAQLMNISVRGVEISRYRLRKKLGISSEVNLYDYLISLTGTAKNN